MNKLSLKQYNSVIRSIHLPSSVVDKLLLDGMSANYHIKPIDDVMLYQPISNNIYKVSPPVPTPRIGVRKYLMDGRNFYALFENGRKHYIGTVRDAVGDIMALPEYIINLKEYGICDYTLYRRENCSKITYTDSLKQTTKLKWKKNMSKEFAKYFVELTDIIVKPLSQLNDLDLYDCPIPDEDMYLSTQVGSGEIRFGKPFSKTNYVVTANEIRNKDTHLSIVYNPLIFINYYKLYERGDY